MPEVIFNGPAGRLEGQYRHSKTEKAPLALILHPHPQFGGSMNNPVIYRLYQAYIEKGFSVLRFNFRGVGRSQGSFDGGVGELSDAATALDWLQAQNAESGPCWIAGFSFGAWIAMQVLMRRPEIDSFVAVAPPANLYDFTFLAPCPSSGLILTGSVDQVAPEADTLKLVERLKTQKGIVIEHQSVTGANHFFESHLDEMTTQAGVYVDKRMDALLPDQDS